MGCSCKKTNIAKPTKPSIEELLETPKQTIVKPIQTDNNLLLDKVKIILT